eukprot:6714184-Lingulodinium_polyedra.AAC.1
METDGEALLVGRCSGCVRIRVWALSLGPPRTGVPRMFFAAGGWWVVVSGRRVVQGGCVTEPVLRPAQAGAG